MTRFLSLLLLLAFVAGCRPDAPMLPLDGPLPEQSLYALDVEWTTQDAQPVQLEAFRGQPVVLAMVYAHCAYACPVIVNDMKRIAAKMSDRADVQYVLVSLDPERDTPEQLRSLRDGFGLGDDWTLLRGDPRHVRQLAALLGVRYKKEASGEISHSNLITILDREGQMATQQEGLGTDPAPTIQTLRTLLATR